MTSLKAQNQHNSISFEVVDMPLDEVIGLIDSLSTYNFSYNSMIMPVGSLFTYECEGKKIEEVLDAILNGTDITYQMDHDQIILKLEEHKRSTSEDRTGSFEIMGTVRNKISNEMISDVIVYLDGTSLAATTNEYGYFRIENVPLGSYKIVFSHISFSTRVYEFSKSLPGDLTMSTDLVADINLLKEVEVLANPIRPSEGDRQMLELFSDQFLGRSNNAIACQILNPEVLKFTRGTEKEELIAKVSEPLIIQNYALGYLLFCELESFESTNNNVKYVGRLRFEELTPKDERQSKLWSTNRKNTYRGSMREFFKSVVEKKHRKHGYRAYYVDGINEVYSKNLREARMDSLLVKTDVPMVFRINLDQMLYVTYIKEVESEEYIIDMERDILKNLSFGSNRLLFLNRTPDVQKSLLEVKEGPIYVDVNGNLVNPSGLSVSGYWSWERIADLVPINFNPEK